MTSVYYLEDILIESTLDDILYICTMSNSEAWSAMNEPEVNGEWWNNKRMMLAPELGVELKRLLLSLNLNINNLSATNKVQRLFQNEILGPITDKDHVPEMKYGSILFLNDNCGNISFPEWNLKFEARRNSLVIYPADVEYIISGPKTPNFMFFTTVFMD